ncbi:MAG: hypothetical protein ACTSWY_15470, partial [Promethearchaeota archaeon]
FEDIWKARQRLHIKASMKDQIVYFGINSTLKKSAFNGEIKILSNLKKLAGILDGDSSILFFFLNDIRNEKYSYDYIISKTNLPKNPQIIIFKNESLRMNFFNWELIGILQTLKENLSV